MYIEILKQEERYSRCFRRLNDSKNGTADAYSGYKLTSTMCLVYLEVKVKEGNCDGYIQKLKCQKNDRNKIFRGKQASKVPLLFLDVKMPKERYDRRF